MRKYDNVNVEKQVCLAQIISVHELDFKFSQGRNTKPIVEDLYPRAQLNFYLYGFESKPLCLNYEGNALQLHHST